MSKWICEHCRPVIATVAGVTGGGESAWILVNNVTTLAGMVGALAGALAAVCSLVYWIRKLSKQERNKE